MVTQDATFEGTIPAALVAVTRKSREFATGSVPWAISKTYGTCKDNFGLAVTCGTTGIGLLLIAAPGAVAAPSLAAAGFGSGGVVLGSTAAGIQSGIGSVVAPSIFATLQSGGAGGCGAATVYGAIQVAGGVVDSSAMGALACCKAKL